MTNLPGNPKQEQNQEDADQIKEDTRNKAVYEYLLTLTDTEVGKKDNSKGRTPEQSTYSISEIKDQWKINRMSVYRILRNLRPKLYPGKKEETLPGLNLSKLVDILAALKDHWSKNEKDVGAGKSSKLRRITREDIVKALRLFTQLSPTEEETLGIRYHNVLLQRLSDSIHELSADAVPEATVKVYEKFLAIKQYSDLNSVESKNTEETIKSYIKKNLRNSILYKSGDLILIDVLYHKYLRRIKRVEMQNGSEIFNYLINENNVNHSQFAINALTKCVVENHILTESFPIHIKYIEVRKNPALPLYLHGSTSVINENFYSKSEKWINSIQMDVAESLKHLVSFTVKVHFYIDLPPENIFSIKNPDQSKISNLDIDINHIPGSDGQDRYVVDFLEEITGTGSPISQAIAAINRVLFWDIPLLKDYFPVPKNFIISHKVLGDSSNAMIHGHNVIGLFKKNDLNIDSENNDVEKKIKYIEQYVQESAAGDYCGFDVLEVTAKSALYARLRAIKQIGIDNNEYIKEILNRIQEINALRKAKSLLEYFPFSSLAMKDYIQNSIFNENSKYIESSARDWSMVAHDAHLEIAEAFLKEGLFVLGKKYLDLMGHLKQDSNKIDSLIRAKYYLCMFRYHYLNDVDPDKPASLHDEEAKKQAGQMLDNANSCLEEYIKKHHLIDEKQCAIFYDFFHILSRVNAHRAKLNLFREGHEVDDKIHRAIRLFENARIFAARDGNPSLYSIWTAYQSWCYVMRAYLQSSGEKQEDLNWAEKLLNHAKICYSEKGKKCYEDIKANAGQSYPNDGSGSIYIDKIPFIVEVDSRKDIGLMEELLKINMSVFRQDYSTYSSKSSGYKKIYLFGTQSCLLLFAMGILKLCKNYDSDRELKDAIEESKELFTYSWSIAEEGFKKKASAANGIVDTKFERQFDIREASTAEGRKISSLIPEFSVCGLYPHRLTQFADFGKIFSIACALINLAIVQHPDTIAAVGEKTIQENKELINYLKDRLTENNCYFNSEETHKEHERYNGHLRSIYNQIKRRANDLMEKGATYSSVKDARDQIVRDFFRIILTRAAVP
jgi:hypothetical protein